MVIRITPKDFKGRKFRGKSKKRYVGKVGYFCNVDEGFDFFQKSFVGSDYVNLVNNFRNIDHKTVTITQKM